jgi:hypothetical protein
MGLNRSAAGNQVDDQHHDCYNQKQVNQAAADVPKQTNKPQDQ